MARWKVTAKHYIHAEQYGQPTEWERQETNQATGRLFRKAYKVPMFVDPEDPFCVNKFEGFCVVARKGFEKPGDIVFFGPPTPDMEPLDDAATAETEAERPKWVNPMESLPVEVGQEFGKQILDMLQRQLDAAERAPAPVSLKSATNPEIESMKAMIAKQQEMIEKLIAGQAPAPTEPSLPSDAEQVIDDEPPLPLVEPTPEEEARAKLAAEANDALSQARAKSHVQRRQV